jgi:hypothetical protein
MKERIQRHIWPRNNTGAGTNSYIWTDKLHFEINKHWHNKDNEKQTRMSENDNRHTKREQSWVPHIPTLAATGIQSGNQKFTHLMQQELVREKLKKLATKLEIFGISDTRSLAIHSSCMLNQQPITMKFMTLNIHKTWESKLSFLTKNKIIYCNARDIKHTPIPKGTVHTDQDVWSMINYIALNNLFSSTNL